MKCNQVQPNLLDYSRGLLNRPETSAIKAHLEGCAECRQVLKAESELADRLSGSPKPATQADIWLRVQPMIRHESRRRTLVERLHLSLSRKITVAAAVFVIMAIALFNLAPRHTPAPVQSQQAEKESIKQAVALIQVQPASDNTDGETTDAMMKVLDDEL